ncbi:hypothetical protein [Rubellimicrobium aerolatum]|uniref:Uncharacterized protein n=1 Tax=Rubellimicrobium aerolatum TaxID=490979 RepID=A0ABW0SCN5_9RHOB|nr:hypothetical protein [Rubellimicrobium aerolatum]MBP1806368.1 hypothetical protein [Rubellimicrobium aerolatum]
MRTAGDLVNNFNEGLDQSEAISVIGFQSASLNGQPAYNILGGLERYSVQTERFDECFAIGSGREVLLKFIKKYSEIVPSNSDVFLSGLANIINLAGALNSVKLFNDTSDRHKDTWGGYIEYRAAYGHSIIGQTQNWSHVAVGIDLSGNSPRMSEHVKQYHYWPGSKRLLTTFRSDNGEGVVASEWRIKSLLSPNDNVAGPAHWNSFTPDFVTVCYNFRKGRMSKSGHYTYEGRALGAGLSNAPNSIWLTLSPDFIKDEIEKFMPHLPI